MDINIFDTVCFSGGGLNGLAIIGVINYYIKHKLIKIKKINNWVGTSCGAILGFFYVLGYKTKEINEFVINFNFKKLIPEPTIDNLLGDFGIDTGAKIVIILIKFLKKKLNKSDITFIELFELTNKFYCIIGTNFTKSCERAFNYKKTPNMSVITAIRISISVPFIFTPVKFENDFYIDGAFVNNFPINYCNPKTTLGIYIKSNTDNKIASILDLVLGCCNIVNTTITEKNNTNNNFNIIHLEHCATRFVDFNLDKETKQYIINSGYLKAKQNIESASTQIANDIINNIIDNIIDKSIQPNNDKINDKINDNNKSTQTDNIINDNNKSTQTDNIINDINIINNNDIINDINKSIQTDI